MKKLSSRLILLTMLLSATAYGQVPTAGLVGEYKFTSGSLSDGISTNDFTQTGTALTNVTDRSGDANNAIDLGGDYLQRNYLHSASLSVSFLMKTTTNNGNKTTIIDQTTRTGDTEDGWGWYIYLQNGRVGVTGKFGAYAPYSSQAGGWSGYSPYTNTLGTSTLSDDEWHHVTVTMTPSTYRPSNGTFVRFYYYYNVYVDNVLESSSTSEITTPGGSYNFYSYAPSSNLLSTTTNVTIANNHNTNLSNKYGDEIDNLRFYNVTLTATDVEGLFTDELCAAPMYVNLSSRTTGSLDIDWSDNGIPTDWDLSYVATGQPANNGTIVSNIGTNSYDITGLSPYTSYDVYVRSHCTAGVTDWSSAATFTTYNVTYVDASATGANNGASWNDAFTDLQDGIALGNTIWVAAGTYTPAASGRTATFSIKNGSRLYGGFNGTETDQSQRNITANATILSGDLSGDDNSTILDTEATRAENSYHVITFRTVQNVIIDGFTIAGGNANGVLSNNCGIAAASQYDHTRGGAIYTNPYIQTQVVSAKFSNCIIEKNTGTSVAVYSSFTPCGVTGLTTDVDFESCIIRDNYSKDLTAMLFIGSSGYQIYSKGSIVNSLMYNNTSNAHSSCLYLGVSTSNGGGAAGLEFEMINTTITKNSGANGNAIYMTNSSNSTIDNSIIYGNGSATPFSIAGSGSVVSNSIIEGGQQSGLDSDPLFTDAANDDFTIGCSSPALDAGNSSVTLPAIDIAGNNRVQTTLDMGAYEYSEPILTAITAIAQDFVVELDADGNAAVTSDDVNNGTGAACGVEFTLSLDKTAFTCADLGDNVVTLTATEDIGGADDQTTATVTIVYPVITQDITVQLDASGDASIIAADIDNGTNTTCTSAHTLSLDKTDFTCADLGDNIVTLSSDDGAGNIRTATATVTVENPITVVTQDISVQLDAITGIATIMADDIDNGSSDSCSGALILSLSKTEFVCADIGANLVTLTIEDVHGNQLTANATVTVSSIVDDETVTVENASICLGGSTTISTGSSVSGNNYYLRNSADDEIVDGPIAGTGSGLDFNTGTLNTATTFNVSADQSVNNQAIKLAGTSGYITIPNSNSLQLNENWTLEAWVKPTGALLHVIETYDGNGGFVLRSNGTHWQAYAMYSSSVASLVTSSTSVVLNEWVHIAATFNETTNELKIYVNGVVDATNSAATIDQRGSLTAIKFGARGDDNQIRNESIQDEMRIWNVERTAQEIADNMSAHLIGNESGLVAYYDVNDLTFEANNMTIPDKSSNANAGTIAGTYTSSNIVDGANIQSNSCPFQMTTEVTVTVEDLTAPTAVIQDITVQLDAAGNATITAADINNGSSDNCTAANDLILSLDVTALTCAELGANTVTLTVEDATGNESTATATVTVQDVTLPTAIGQNISLALDAAGTATLVTSDLDNGSTDNCTAAIDLVFSADITSFDGADLGENTVQFMVDDASGNQAVSEVIVTITDEIAPTATTKNITVDLDETGNVTIVGSDVNDGSTDNGTADGDLVMTLDVSAFDCSHAGSNDVILTVIDGSGNESTSTAIVTVQDVLVPTVVVQDVTVNIDASGNGTLTAIEVNNESSDNCTASGDLVLSLDKTVFTISDLGTNTVTLTVTDAKGNSASGTATVTVEQKTDQTITFAGLDAVTYGVASIDLSATATSELAVSFELISGAASLSGNTLSISGAGDIVIEASQGGNDDFAAASKVQQTLIVNKAPLTVTAVDQTITFGSEIPSFTKVYAGFVNNDVTEGLDEEPAISITATSASNAGTYDIALSGGFSANYEFTLVKGVLTIEMADQVISIDPIADKVVTDAAFAVSVSADSQLDLVISIESGPATISGNTITLSGAPGMVIVLATQAGNDNYNSSTANVSFAVTDPSLQDQTIIFEPLSDKVYGDQFSLTALASSELSIVYVVTEGPATITGNTVSITGIGEVTIEATQGGNGSFNPASAVSQSFLVSKRALLLTADNLSTTFGDAIPDLTFSLSGLVDGDDASVLTEQPQLSTVSSHSNAGTYEIMISGSDAANYMTSTANGTLTINAVVATISLTELSQQADGTVKMPRVVTSPVDLIYVMTFGGLTAPSVAGSYQVTVTIDEENYSGTKTETFTITADPSILSVTPMASVLVYPNPASGSLYVKLSDSAESTARLFNLQGVAVKESHSKLGQYEMDVSQLENGIYVLIVSDKTHLIKREKIFINN